MTICRSGSDASGTLKENFEGVSSWVSTNFADEELDTYWPGMDEDIEQLVKTCIGCTLAVKSPPIRYKPQPQIFSGLEYK